MSEVGRGVDVDAILVGGEGIQGLLLYCYCYEAESMCLM